MYIGNLVEVILNKYLSKILLKYDSLFITINGKPFIEINILTILTIFKTRVYLYIVLYCTHRYVSFRTHIVLQKSIL